MRAQPRICVVAPVYNHSQTIIEVARGARQFLPVIAVNDGSTDDTPRLLEAESGITVVHLTPNQGKGAALRAGFAKAEQLGFTHVISIDADGQHPTSALPGFIAACQKHPDALISGVRDLRLANAPWSRRLTNALSTFWFKFETGADLRDTQCGYRVYPLGGLRPFQVRAGGYAFELELLAKAAWAGIPILGHPIQADYSAPTSQLSHFKPLRDFMRIAAVHARLVFLTICVPALRHNVLRHPR
jgi:glycosyltransferase involved in cell wall biosynthesis